MFYYQSKRVSEDSIKYRFIDKEENYLSYREFLENLSNGNKEFLNTFFASLEEATEELNNYFWECVPVSTKTIDKRFEFVVTKSTTLEQNERKKGQEFITFDQHLKESKNEDVASFLNLGNDAFLIVPMPKLNSKKKHFIQYKNISQFITNSHRFPDQQVNFWKEVADNFIEILEDPKEGRTLWLSTDGTGVNYLHVRIDIAPKYYSWKKYWKEQKTTTNKATEIENVIENKKRNREEFDVEELIVEEQNQIVHEQKKVKKEQTIIISLIFILSIILPCFFHTK